ncbi:uncharacterized protein LOC62_02G002926 [Vanrija pseudolonga]|uniref:BRCT domain-containing protein n=1 Tax=Vanrija pseudolonga TaxID=143232 RepID=A0AAF0Y7A9_9TREE|nr:hypothetical protein LOC62_02G002926 [Vanrija pseudolonga]
MSPRGSHIAISPLSIHPSTTTQHIMPPRKTKTAPAKPLQGTTIVICGTFERPNTLATLTERVKALGGDTHPTVTKAVTHVISSKYYYDANGAKVRPALGNDKVKIVSYDWLVEVEKKGEKVDEARFVFKALPANPVGGLDTLAATTAAIEDKKNGKKCSAPADGEDKAPKKAAKADAKSTASTSTKAKAASKDKPAPKAAATAKTKTAPKPKAASKAKAKAP